MKGLLRFLKTTLVGGILFLVPVIVLVVIVGKAVMMAGMIVNPLAAHISIESVMGLPIAKLLAGALIVLLCFLAGIVARAAFARKLMKRLESAALAKVPGYEFIKTTFGSTIGAGPEHAHQVVLARIEDAWQIAFLIERLEGGHVAVFVPGAPNPLSGSVYFMSQDRIKPINIPSADALKCLQRLGAGSNLTLGAMPEDKRPT